jgi:hypothetical protein
MTTNAAPEPSRNWGRSLRRDQSWGGCRLCRHFQAPFRCAAFPDAIPPSILFGEVDHLVPRPGQVGDILFELVTDPTPVQLLLLRGAARRGVPGAAEVLASVEAEAPRPAEVGAASRRGADAE